MTEDDTHGKKRKQINNVVMEGPHSEVRCHLSLTGCKLAFRAVEKKNFR